MKEPKNTLKPILLLLFAILLNLGVSAQFNTETGKLSDARTNPKSAATVSSSSLLVNDTARSIPAIIQGRDFPSIFQAWNKADNLWPESKDETIARHDLYWHAPEVFGLFWNNTKAGLADGFYPGSIEKALAYKKKLRQLNPNIILIAELRYRDAHSSYLPNNHEWWMHDKDGNLVYGWKEGNYIRLELRDPALRENVALKAKAAVESGVFDGVFLDWWTENEYLNDRLDLIRRVRKAIGDSALIIVNSNQNTVPRSANYVNGIFMECWDSSINPTDDKWRKYLKTLTWAEENLKSPRVNCFETWYGKSRNELNRMRATTTMTLTCSDGYSLFGDPNQLPTGDHLHSWYPFYDVELGKPVRAGTLRPDGAHEREFTGGIAIYNPIYNTEVEFTTTEPHMSMATGKIGTSHTVPSFDGDIFVTAEPNSSAVTPKPGFRLYPNPFTYALNVETTDPIESATLYSLLGIQIQVAPQIEANKARIATGHVKNGVYVLKLETSKGTVFQKCIKN
jgi:hypothetical protein